MSRRRSYIKCSKEVKSRCENERAREIVGGCTCHEAYKSRDLTAPDCAWCNYGEEIADALAAAEARGKPDQETLQWIIDKARAESRDAGLEEAAKVADGEAFATGRAGMIHCQSEAEHIARCIRAIRAKRGEEKA